MAYKVFSNGDALTGGELNTYLMNQAVISFASTTARDAALPSPSEGQLVWLEDSNKYVYYTGSAWAELIVPAASGNQIINGAFEVNQRAYTSSTSSGFPADRFKTYVANGTVTWSREAFTLGSAPVAGYEAPTFLRSAVSGQSATSAASFISQKMEDVRTFAGQTVTVSFWAKAASGTPKIGLEYAQGFGTGGSPSTTVATHITTVTLTTSWTRYSATVAIPSIAGKTLGTDAINSSYLEFGFWMSAGSDFASRSGSIGIQNSTIDIWGVQVEAGTTATAFRRNANSLQGEVAACQRYYFRNRSVYGGFDAHATGIATGSTTALVMLPMPVTMRIPPTSAEFSTIEAYDGADHAISALSVVGPSDNNLLISVTSTGLTAYRPVIVFNQASINGYIGVSAEF